MRAQSALVRRRLKPKVILVPRKPNETGVNRVTMDMALAALRTPPGERSDKETDTILAIVGKWKDFNNFIHTEQEKREVCRRIFLEEKKGGQVLFNLNDPPDGWYLVFRGMCSIYIKWNDDSNHQYIHPHILSQIREKNPTTNFKCVAAKLPGTEFGSTALTQNILRTATIYIDEDSILLRVDPQVYKDTAAWFAKNQLEKKAAILSQVEELQFLKDTKEVFSRLAENMVEVKMEPGTILTASNTLPQSKGRGFLLIEDGLLIKQRMVDFSKFKRAKLLQNDDANLPIRIPTGNHLVRIATYGPKCMFPDPALDDFVKYPFIVTVIEPTTAHVLVKSDLDSLLLTTQIHHLQDEYLDQPNDEQVVKMWVNKQKEIQWNKFKKQCVKEARRYVRTERAVLNGQWAMRNPKQPKSIKDHKPFTPIHHNRD